MIIRNKFNGYGFDGVRLCHDPVSLSIAATQAGAASAAAATAAAAAAPTLTAAGTAAAGTAAAQTAGLELAKQQAIQAGTQQLGQQAAQQGITQLGQQAAQQAAQQGLTQAGQQGIAQLGQQTAGQIAQQGTAQLGQQMGAEAAKESAVEAAKQGIFSANPAGMPPTAQPVVPGAPMNAAGPLPPAGGYDPAVAEQLGRQNAERLAAEGFKPAPPGQAQTLVAGDNAAPSVVEDIPQYLRGIESASKEIVPEVATGADAVKAAQASSQQVSQFTPDVPKGIGADLPTNPLAKGFETGLQYVKDNPVTTGIGLMSAGQYMNEPEEEDKDKYKNTVDMSKFRASTPTQRPFTRSYEYQSYAVGGPIEQMSAMNSVGANTGYPMAALQTPNYSNPGIARPEATNVIAPTVDAGVNSYSGEPRFAEGGLSEATRREYGLKTRGQRAAQRLTKSYEEMEEERQKEAMKLFGERTDPGIVPRSRTQMLSSPFSAAQAEHARLGKKAKVPVIAMPKTNLGDIDTYMDIPIEAAQGGIMHGLGGYSDGGRLLKGPGDGVSDSIPAVIGKRQPARLADGEFVIPARIVSELGNGSTEAGARKLYAMMERVQASRKKSIGKKKVAVNSKADKHLPA